MNEWMNESFILFSLTTIITSQMLSTKFWAAFRFSADKGKNGWRDAVVSIWVSLIDTPTLKVSFYDTTLFFLRWFFLMNDEWMINDENDVTKTSEAMTGVEYVHSKMFCSHLFSAKFLINNPHKSLSHWKILNFGKSQKIWYLGDPHDLRVTES